MLDVTRVLDPRSGVVADFDSVPPDGASRRLWSAGSRLECEHDLLPGEDPRLFSCATGACSLVRANAVLRAAGESVERLALHRADAVPGRYADLRDRALPFFDPALSLGADPGDRVLRWYAGRDLVEDREVLVPAGLVDYPAAPEDRDGFDPGPSGAAAGSSYDAALKGALLETVERDAVIVAWSRQLRLRRVDVDGVLAAAPADRHWSHLARVVRVAREDGLEPVLAEVPTSVPGVTCVVGGLRTRIADRPVVCLGASASDHVGRALLGAFEESFQLYYYLAEHPRLTEPGPVTTVVAGDHERVRFLASPAGVEALEAWLETDVDADLDLHRPALDVDELLAAVRADGLRPVLLDLSERLPDAVRTDGWRVVKVVPVGYQPLRIDERTAFGWSDERLRSASDRTGAEARRPPDEPCPFPHPLP